MEIFGFLLFLLLLWASYRIFVSGPGSQKSFLQYYQDQNDLRKWIQDQGGIHKVESENIRRMENAGYATEEYGENFVSFRKWNSSGYMEVKITYGQEKRRHLQVGYHRDDKSETTTPRNKTDVIVDESEDTIQILNQAVDRHLSSSQAVSDVKNSAADQFKVSVPASNRQNSTGGENLNSQEQSKNPIGKMENIREAMSLEEHDQRPSDLSIRDIKDKFHIIDKQNVNTLRKGKACSAGSVIMAKRAFINDPDVKSAFQFNVMTEGALSEARAMISESGYGRITRAALSQIDFCGALFMEPAESPLPHDRIPLEGERANISIKLTRSNNHALEVEDFNPGPHKDSFVSYPMTVGGVTTNLSPRRHSTRNDLINVEDFEEWFTLLSREDSRSLRSGNTVTLRGVRLHEIETLTGGGAPEDLSSQKIYFFSVVAEEDLTDLDRVALARQEGIYIDYFSFKNSLGYFKQSLPSYSSLTEEDPLPDHDLVVGDRCDISLGMANPDVGMIDTIVDNCDPLEG